MIKHVFKIIWSDRNVNFWILIGLILVSCILWFCTDYAIFLLRRYIQPEGFNIENTYLLQLTPQQIEDGEHSKIKEESVWSIYNKIQRYPDIEYVAASSGSYPYYKSVYIVSDLMVNNDTIKILNVEENSVSPDFFNVFGMKLETGRWLSWDDAREKYLIAGDYFNKISSYDVFDIQQIRDGKSFTRATSVMGVLSRIKEDPLAAYKEVVFQIMPKSFLAHCNSFCIRIKSHVNQAEFVRKFQKEMNEQLTNEAFTLKSITPFSDYKESHMKKSGYENDFKSVLAIVVFLLVNIFLGLIGVFWLRTRDRRNEIGLRMTIGSTKKSIKKLFVGEALLLVLIACVIGAAISVNIGAADVLDEMGLPTASNRVEPMDFLQYFLNFFLTFFIMALVSSLAVWYPARKAAEIQPAIALRDE